MSPSLSLLRRPRPPPHTQTHTPPPIDSCHHHVILRVLFSPHFILFSFFFGPIHSTWEYKDKEPDVLVERIKHTWLCFCWKTLTS